LLPYFSFRSKSEQEQRHDPEWPLAMAYHDDLLKQALQLVHKEPKNPSRPASGEPFPPPTTPCFIC
jgi:hypothetical protein